MRPEPTRRQSTQRHQRMSFNATKLGVEDQPVPRRTRPLIAAAEIAAAGRREEELSHQTTNEYQATAELGVGSNACSGLGWSRHRNKTARWERARTRFPLNGTSGWGEPGEPKKARYATPRNKILPIMARIRLKLVFLVEKRSESFAERSEFLGRGQTASLFAGFL